MAIKITIDEVAIRSGQTAEILIYIDDRKVKISVPKEVKAHFDDQFVRPNPTSLQKKKYTTLMALLRAAYNAGRNSRAIG